MPNFDFPPNPTNGQQYTLNGQTYTWNGYAWTGGTPVAAALSGSWVQIGKVDVVPAVPVARVAVPGISNVYSEYILRIADLEMDVNTQYLGMQISVDNGANGIGGTGYQFYNGDLNSGATATALNSATSTSLSKNDRILVGAWNFLSTAAEASLDASIRFVAPGAGKRPKFNFDSVYIDQSNNVRGAFGFGGNLAQTTFNALLFMPWASGNIRKGSFILSGRVR